ncbi:MAG: TRAP transporter small permease [Dehalococcoidales bacterium]|nr:TRAP transporter small permease [Dehalococcoidales bacterium]
MEKHAEGDLARKVRLLFLSGLIISLSKIVDPLAGVVAVVIGGIMLTGMMFLMFFDVALQIALNTPLDGTLELTEFMMALLVVFGLGFCAGKRGHIRVDLVMQYIPARVKCLFDVVAYAFSAAFYLLISWQTGLNAWNKISSNLTTGVLYIPVYPFIFLVAAGAFIVTLVFIRDFLKSLEEAVR